MDSLSGLGSRKAEKIVGPERDHRFVGDVHGPHMQDSMRATQQLRPNRRVVSLTWQDVWVTVGDDESGCVPILQGLTGFARPGEVLAIMGPSGCGKSSLLDALAGRLDSKRRQSGQILVNGRREPLAYGTSAYVTQDDVLTSTLTVKEAVYFSAQLQLPDTMLPSEKKQRAEATIREMGLHDAVGTRIGSWGNKGLSNGQRRRVSICMEILTRPKLLFLDEPTSGLDSAASYYVMRRIVGLAKQNDMTVLASVHQPSSEVFGLFHSLCLLSQGRTVYFGPSSKAPEFFSLNGFPCPSMQNPSDHYLRTINTDFDEDIDPGLGGKPRTQEVIKVLVQSYKSSNFYGHVLQQIADIHQKVDHEVHEKESRACFFTQFLVLVTRSFMNMYRDLGYYWMRLLMYVAIALSLGTVFYQIGLDYDSIHARGSLITFVASFLTIMAIGGYPSFIEDLKVFERERLNGHYGSGAFVLANTLSSVPFLLMISLIPGAITYYLVGLQRELGHFLFFATTLLACMMLVESLMMIVASVVPSFLMGLTAGSGIQGLMILGGGFFRLPNDLPRVFWRYPVYYLSFNKYAFHGMFKNEFEGLMFPRNPASLAGTGLISGEDVLKDTWQVEMSYTKWTDLAILFEMVIAYRLIFFGVLKTTETLKPVAKEIMSAWRRRKGQDSVNPLRRSSSPESESNNAVARGWVGTGNTSSGHLHLSQC
ncbi:ABC transporter G family member 1-like [Rhodamnia argentea]|uniref:ABC transporter G family member 1-like n=1 Tax=Rhodamnia argentea TaxID=178133 RepID=A0A8B8QL30_9MYRT|nr:ABC transporter G family member 1-like [Rhodamnia argentea]